MNGLLICLNPKPTFPSRRYPKTSRWKSSSVFQVVPRSFTLSVTLSLPPSISEIFTHARQCGYKADTISDREK